MLQAIKKIPTTLKVVLFSLVIISVFVVSFVALKKQFIKLNGSNGEYLVKIDHNRTELFDNSENPYLKKAEKSILREKVKVLQIQREQHLNLMCILLQDYYAFLTLFPIFSGLTALCAFILLQNGWKAGNLYLKTAFVNFALLSAITKVFPDVYEQKSNISNYTNMYIEYSKLKKDILSYNLTAPQLYKDSIDFKNFLMQIHDKERALIEFHLGLQQKEITKDAFDINK